MGTFRTVFLAILVCSTFYCPQGHGQSDIPALSPGSSYIAVPDPDSRSVDPSLESYNSSDSLVRERSIVHASRPPSSIVVPNPDAIVGDSTLNGMNSSTTSVREGDIVNPSRVVSSVGKPDPVLGNQQPTGINSSTILLRAKPGGDPDGVKKPAPPEAPSIIEIRTLQCSNDRTDCETDSSARFNKCMGGTAALYAQSPTLRTCLLTLRFKSEFTPKSEQFTLPFYKYLACVEELKKKGPLDYLPLSLEAYRNCYRSWQIDNKICGITEDFCNKECGSVEREIDAVLNILRIFDAIDKHGDNQKNGLFLNDGKLGITDLDVYNGACRFDPPKPGYEWCDQYAVAALQHFQGNGYQKLGTGGQPFDKEHLQRRLRALYQSLERCHNSKASCCFYIDNSTLAENDGEVRSSESSSSVGLKVIYGNETECEWVRGNRDLPDADGRKISDEARKRAHQDCIDLISQYSSTK